MASIADSYCMAVVFGIACKIGNGYATILVGRDGTRVVAGWMAVCKRRDGSDDLNMMSSGCVMGYDMYGH